MDINTLLFGIIAVILMFFLSTVSISITSGSNDYGSASTPQPPNGSSSQQSATSLGDIKHKFYYDNERLVPI